MESTTIFTTSTNETMKPNMTYSTQAPCDVPAKEAFIFAYSVEFLISLVLNCITMCVCIRTNQQAQSNIMVYMKNLVAADFFLCLCLLLYIASYVNNSNIMYTISCSFGTTAFYVNMYASILFMGFIALFRYLKIAWPLTNQALQTVRTARYISVSIWLSLLILSSIYLIFFIQTSWGEKLDHFSCESQQSAHLSVAYKAIHCVTFVSFIFILVSLIVLYCKTLEKLRQVQFSTQTEFSLQKIAKSKRNMRVLVVIFCVCFVPYQLVKLPYLYIKPLLNDCTTVQTFYILKEVTNLLAALNASLDPLIYFFSCKTFRDQLNFRAWFYRQGSN